VSEIEYNITKYLKLNRLNMLLSYLDNLEWKIVFHSILMEGNKVIYEWWQLNVKGINHFTYKYKRLRLK